MSHPPCLEQGLEPSRCSVNICWKKWLSLSSSDLHSLWEIPVWLSYNTAMGRSQFWKHLEPVRDFYQDCLNTIISGKPSSHPFYLPCYLPWSGVRGEGFSFRRKNTGRMPGRGIFYQGLGKTWVLRFLPYRSFCRSPSPHASHRSTRLIMVLQIQAPAKLSF